MDKKILSETDLSVEIAEIKGKTLLPFYIYIAEIIGYSDEDIECYDCRKMWVAENVQEAIIESYQAKYSVNYAHNSDLITQEITSTLVIGGPKMDKSLPNGHVKIEPGFIILKEAK